MKLDKITNKIHQIEQAENEKQVETISKIDKLNDELKSVIAKIEETYITGDAEQGGKLLTEKASLEAQITFLENYQKKRKDIPLIDKEEARRIMTDLNNELYNTYFEQKRKYEELVKQIEEIGSTMDNAINTYQATGTDLNRISKNNGVPQVNNTVVVFNQHIHHVINGYKNHSLPYLNNNEPK